MHVQLWSPDTCGCVIHQRVNDDGTVDNISAEEANAIVGDLRTGFRVGVDAFTGGRQEGFITNDPQPPGHICNVHASAPDPHDAVTVENRGKNHAFEELQKLRPDAAPEHYRWSFDENRVLQVEVDLPLSAAEKGQLQAALHARLGEGRARVR